MQKLLIFNYDESPFTLEPIQRIFETELGFQDIRFTEPGGAAIEAEYVEEHDRTIVRLNGSQKTISMTGQSDAALRVALILQRRLENPLRIIDLDYAFDLVLKDFDNIDELRTAIETAQGA